jgi:phosphatidylglycerophosphate synthase
VAVAPQHWLSLARLVVGAVAWRSLSRADASAVVLPLVVLASILDFADGRLARSRGTEGGVGRVIDNACDFAFLAMFFHAAGGVQLWSVPPGGVVVRWCEHANTLPLLALFLSFGAYAARASFCAVFASELLPSPIGRTAGVLNYALALLGAAAVSLQLSSGSPLLEAGMAAVVSVNVAACVENLVLLARQLVLQSWPYRTG